MSEKAEQRSIGDVLLPGLPRDLILASYATAPAWTMPCK